MLVKKKKFFFGDMSKILRGYEGKWVALSIENGQIRVRGSGNSPDKAIDNAKQNGVDDPVLVKVPTESFAYVI